MPSRSKKKKAIKRKKETPNHQNPPNSSAPQGNGPGEDSSDHALSDEEFSLRPSMEAQSEAEHEDSGDASAIPIERQTEVATAVPSVPLEVKEESGEGRSYGEGAEIPVSVSRELSEVKEKSVEGSSYSVGAEIPVSVSRELSAPVEVKETSGEGSSYSERAEIPVSIPRDTPAAGPYPLLERRSSWWNCCGLLDVFGGYRS